ncbi:DUF1707 and DUF4190 domain-containing protein [Streptomyces sp. CC219B]|uniref:DUF1707 and DUF4190 domain-containing protein n=1 Tax=Streptomyces sp. CC219B TaxID=3044574 RepID=UPI0024A7D4D2|nr:DUF1707 and DUF4190 domain-containing protein [Streptomyces sp. CC219B]
MTHPSWQPWQGDGVPQSSQGSGAPTGWQKNGVPQPWQGGPASQGWAGQGGPSMLASHADRERAVDVLRAGYGEGRLEQPEFEKRVSRAYAARTVGELALLVADLPQGPVPHAAPVTLVPQTFLPVPRPRTNGKAVGSAVCGVLCLVSFGFTAIPAVVLGHAARSEMARTGEGGDGFALLGLVLGWLSVAGWAVLLTLAVVAGAASG